MSPSPDSHLAVLPEIHSAGVMMFDPVWARRVHTSRVCELLHVIAGRVTMVIGRRRVEATAGDTLVIPAGVAHRDEFNLRQGLKVLMVFFTWPAALDAFECTGPRSALSSADRDELGRILGRLQSEWGSDENDGLLHRSRLLTALLLLSRQARPQRPMVSRPSPQRQIMLQAKTYLQEHFAEPVALDDIAAALGISPYHLSHVFSHESGFSLFAYLTQLRMAHAQALLKRGLKVAAVAREVGYDSPGYFSRAFKKHFGLRPSDVGRS